MLEATRLSAGYGRVQVLWDVDLRVGDNEIVALIGPNGAGKTTLLRALTGMAEVRSGTVDFRGEAVQGRSIEQIVSLGISHVPEGRRLFPGLTVRDNLRLGGWRTRNTNIDRVVDLFPRIGERINQIAGTMSGGEQQMCAIARGLMSEPHIMMIDEQDVDTALTVAERAYVLDSGHIVLSGKASDLLADPRVSQQVGGLAGQDDVAGVQDVRALGDRQRSVNVLLDDHHDVRLTHQPAGDRAHLLLATGHGACDLVDPLADPREQVDHTVDVGVASAPAAQAQVVPHGQSGEEAPALGDMRDAEAD